MPPHLTLEFHFYFLRSHRSCIGSKIITEDNKKCFAVIVYSKFILREARTSREVKNGIFALYALEPSIGLGMQGA